jgi:hypothetical protein
MAGDDVGGHWRLSLFTFGGLHRRGSESSVSARCFGWREVVGCCGVWAAADTAFELG